MQCKLVNYYVQTDFWDSLERPGFRRGVFPYILQFCQPERDDIFLTACFRLRNIHR